MKRFFIASHRDWSTIHLGAAGGGAERGARTAEQAEHAILTRLSSGDNPGFHRPSIAWAAAACAVVLGLVAYIRLFSPPDLFTPVAFGAPLLLGLWFRDRRLLWGMAAALLAINLLAVLSERMTAALPVWSSVIISLNVLIVAMVVHITIGSRRTLETLNKELARTNQELLRREQQINEQNEELHAQAAELEAGSDALQTANDQSTSRQRMLETLLDVSRSIMPGADLPQTMNRICQATAPLVGQHASAAAILELLEGNLIVRGHWGFEPDGIDRTVWSANGSFASQIVTQGRTGYIADITTRPELRLPRPIGGEPFRSIIAVPLRVVGKIVGAFEIFGRQPRQWSTSDIELAEWLARQASAVLEVTTLFRTADTERRRLQTVLQTVPFAVLIANADLTHIDLNPVAQQLLQLPSGFDPRQTRWQEALSVFVNGRLVPHDEQGLTLAVRRKQRTPPTELDVVLADGRRGTFLTSAEPILDAEGKLLGAVSAYVEITQQKALQHELDRRRRLAEDAAFRTTRFLAAVSHDIRTPANAISLVAELIRRAVPADAYQSEAAALVSDLQQNAKYLVSLVSDVLDVTRYDAGSVDFQESDFSLNVLLDEECRRHRPLAQQKNLSLEMLANEPVWVRADRIKLARVVSNLLSNAIKFTERGGVRMKLSKDAHGATLEIADSGVGIPAEHLERVFDEFFQLRNPQRDRAAGTGLGLAICRRLVQAMGGELRVQSEVSKGSTFSVWLPASRLIGPPTGKPAGYAPVNAHNLRGLKVLLVEDHDSTRRATAALLRREGAEVFEADGGQAALAALTNHPDVEALLLDMILPDMDGSRVLEALRGGRPADLRRVLVLSGDVTPQREAEIRRLGADALIAKPVNVERLLRLLAE